MPVVDLTINRNLLCTNFDGYKLSFEPVPVLRQSFQRNPLKREPNSNQYSLLHVELFARHNLLHSDPWARHNCYYVTTGDEVVLCSYDSQHGNPREQKVVYQMQRQDSDPMPGDYNYSLRFISERYCLLCDGMLTYHLLDTGDRERGTPWQLVSKTPIFEEEALRGYVLYDARLDISQERKQISLVAGHVERLPETGVHIMRLVWSRWCVDGAITEAATWTYSVCQHLETKGSIYYCAFEPRAESLLVCSNGELQTRSQREAAEAEAAAKRAADQAQLHNGNGEVKPPFSWTQTEEDVLVRLILPADATRNELDIQSTATELVIKCQGKTLLEGALYASVDNELTTWSVEPELLQLTLNKKQHEHWTRLLINSDVAAADEEQPPMEEERMPITNLEDPIEDCDYPLGSSDDIIKMVRYNLPTAGITHTIFMGSIPPLFSTTLRPGFPAAFVTREGVDAAIWLQMYQPARPQEWSIRHEGTLHALGYVQASKEQKKFIDCSPDLDYAVICESHRHVFIYKPRYDSASGLRNRSKPQVVIGKQNLVTLDDIGEMLGLATAPNVITVLTEQAVLYLQV